MSDLGKVSFSLDANLKALDDANKTLGQFASSAKSLQTSLDRNTKAMEGAFSRVEKATRSASKSQDAFSKSQQQQARMNNTVSKAKLQLVQTYNKEMDVLKQLEMQGKNTKALQLALQRSYDASNKHLTETVKTTNDVTTVMNRFSNTVNGVRKDTQVMGRSVQSVNETMVQGTKEVAAGEISKVRAIESSNRALEDMSAKLRASGGDSTRVANAIKQLEADQQRLTETLNRDNVSKLDAAKATEQWRSSLAKTRRELAGLRSGSDRSLAGMNQRMQDLTKSVQVALGPLSGVASRITAITALANRNTIAVAGLIGSFIGLGAVVAKSVAAASKMEVQMTVLEQRVRNAGEGFGWTAEQLNQLAIELGENTLASASGARDALAMLTTVNGLVGDSLQRALYHAQNLAQLGFGTLDVAARRLVTVLEDPAASLDSLRRAGVDFNDETKNTIQTLIAFGDRTGAVSVILDELDRNLREVATSGANTLAFALDTLQERIVNFFVEAARDGATNALRDSINAISDRILYLTQNTQVLERVFDTFSGIVQATAYVLETLLVNLDKLLMVVGTLAAAKMISAVAGMFTTMSGAMAGATTAAGILTGALRGVWLAITSINPIIGVLSAVVGILAADFIFGSSASDSLEKSYQSLQVRVAALTGSQLKLNDARNAALKIDLQDHLQKEEAARHNIQRRIDELNTQLEQTRLQQEAGAGASEMYKNRITALNTALTELQKEANVSDERIENLQNQLNLLAQELEGSSSGARETAAELQALMEEVQSVSSTVSQAEKAFTSLSAAMQRAQQSDMGTGKRALMDLPGQIQASIQELNNLQSQIDAHVAVIQRMGDTTTDEFKKMQSGLNELVATYNEKMGEMEGYAESLGQTIISLGADGSAAYNDLIKEISRTGQMITALEQGEEAVRSLEQSFQIDDTIARYREQIMQGMLTEEQAVAMKQRLIVAFGLAGNSMAEATIKAAEFNTAINNITIDEEELEEKLTKLRENMQEIFDKQGVGGSVGGGVGQEDPYGDVVAALEQQIDAHNALIAAHRAGGDALNETNSLMEIRAKLIEADLIPATTSLANVEELLNNTTDTRIKKIAELTQAQKELAEQETAYTEVTKSIEDLKEENDQLARQIDALHLSAEAQAAVNDQIAVENALKNYRGKVSDEYLNKLEEELRANQRLSRQLSEEQKKIKDQEKAFNDLVDGAVNYGADMFADFFQGTAGGWQEMLDNMLRTLTASLVRMAAEAALRPIILTVMGAMGIDGSPGGGGGGILGSLFGITGSVHHGGGIAGQPTQTRQVPALAFANAPRLHRGGIAGDEVPAILQRGEEVLTTADPRHRRNQAEPAQNITINISAPGGDPQQIRRSMGRAASELARVVARGQRQL